MRLFPMVVVVLALLLGSVSVGLLLLILGIVGLARLLHPSNIELLVEEGP